MKGYLLAEGKRLVLAVLAFLVVFAAVPGLWRLCAGADHAARSAAADGLRVGIRPALSGLFALGGPAAVELPGGCSPETGEAAAVQGASAG